MRAQALLPDSGVSARHAIVAGPLPNLDVLAAEHDDLDDAAVKLGNHAPTRFDAPGSTTRPAPPPTAASPDDPSALREPVAKALAAMSESKDGTDKGSARE